MSDGSIDPVTFQYGEFLRLPPKPRIVAGIGFMVGGTVLSVLLWHEGFIWALPLFAFAAGIFLSVSGAIDMRKAARRRKYWEAILEHEEEIVKEMLEARSRGRRYVQWLNQHGIHDLELRRYLIDAAELRQ